MPVATRTAAGALTTLQSGTYTNITANFEASVDGSTFFGVALQQMSATTPTYVAAATATGLYILRDIGGIVALRARTTIGAVSGSMTVKGVAGY